MTESPKPRSFLSFAMIFKRTYQYSRLGLLVLLVLLLIACSGPPAQRVIVTIDPGILSTLSIVDQADDGEISVASFNGEDFHYFSNQLIVQVTDDAHLERFLKQFSGSLLLDSTIPDAPATVDPASVRKIDDLGYRLVQLKSPSTNNQRLAQRLAGRDFEGEVRFSSQEAADLFEFFLHAQDDIFSDIVNAELNLVVQPTQATYQEHTTVTGSTGPFLNPGTFWWLDNRTTRVSSPGGAWTLRDRQNRIINGRGVRIAIIDNGFAINNHDIFGRDPFTNAPVGLRNVFSYDFVNNSYILPVVPDCSPISCWHGQNSALVAAATRDNRYGSAGVAPYADLLLYRIAGAGSSYGFTGWFNVGRAVDTAVAWGADVISMSFSATTPGAAGVPGTYVGAALARARNSGVINVAALGNDNRALSRPFLPWHLYDVPAVWDGVIAVGAINSDRRKSSYSNYGNLADIFAPAGESDNLNTLIRTSPMPGLSCYLSNQCATQRYDFVVSGYNGTSAATPVVAGVVALMKQAYPSLNYSSAISILRSTARTDSPDSRVPRVVDARAAVTAARNR